VFRQSLSRHRRQYPGSEMAEPPRRPRSDAVGHKPRDGRNSCCRRTCDRAAIDHLFSIFELTLVFLAFRHSAFPEDFSGITEPENCAIVLAVAAEGEQIYESKPNPAGGFQWSLKAPEAQLKSASGQVVGKHNAGPSWTLNAGSSILGSVPPLKSVAASGSIPWLLIAVKSKSGSGTLDKVDYVLRE
jgi:predicted secreted protein